MNNSKRAREERALAAERRLLALQGKGADGPQNHGSCSSDHAMCAAGDADTAPKDESDNDEDSDYEAAPETDQDRRRAMLDSADQSELDGMKAWLRDYSSDFIFPPIASSSQASPPSSPKSSNPIRTQSKGTSPDLGTIELTSDDEEDKRPRGCDVQLLPQGGTAAGSSGSLIKGKQRDAGEEVARTASTAKKQQKLPYGNLVQDEIKGRKKESLGMTGSGKRLGGAPSDRGGHVRTVPRGQETALGTLPSGTSWTCEVCTL